MSGLHIVAVVLTCHLVEARTDEEVHCISVPEEDIVDIAVVEGHWELDIAGLADIEVADTAASQYPVGLGSKSRQHRHVEVVRKTSCLSNDASMCPYKEK